MLKICMAEKNKAWQRSLGERKGGGKERASWMRVYRGRGSLGGSVVRSGAKSRMLFHSLSLSLSHLSISLLLTHPLSLSLSLPLPLCLSLSPYYSPPPSIPPPPPSSLLPSLSLRWDSGHCRVGHLSITG